MRRAIHLLAALLIWAFASPSAFSDQIPPFFIDCVVALGRLQAPAPGQAPIWITEASGFLYGVPIDAETDPSKHHYEVYLVTNRHVLANHSQIVVRLNSQKIGDPVREFALILKDNKGQDLWSSHPNSAVDVSVLHVNAAYLREQGLQSTFFEADHHVADRAKIKDIGLAVGNDVFVLGFPMGISGSEQRNYVVARRGSIARIEDVLETNGMTFLIDALVFPGNSGGPVVSVPSLNAIEGTKSQDHAYLIGMVRSYLPYRDILASQQTGEVRMISEENSGLAEVIPVDYINETIDASRKAAPQQ
jgi:S1-C subfamily serine protease